MRFCTDLTYYCQYVLGDVNLVMPLSARFVRGFVGLLLLSVILLLSGGRRLCVCFFSALNRCFSYCLLSFACLDGLFCVICLSLSLIAHFCVFFNVFLYAL